MLFTNNNFCTSSTFHLRFILALDSELDSSSELSSLSEEESLSLELDESSELEDSSELEESSSESEEESSDSEDSSVLEDSEEDSLMDFFSSTSGLSGTSFFSGILLLGTGSLLFPPFLSALASFLRWRFCRSLKTHLAVILVFGPIYLKNPMKYVNDVTLCYSTLLH